MADVASILAQFEAGIAGKDTGLGATVKFDFEGAGCVFLDGKASPNTVSGDDQEADCTLTMSVETFEKMSSGELDGTSAFMQGKSSFGAFTTLNMAMSQDELKKMVCT